VCEEEPIPLVDVVGAGLGATAVGLVTTRAGLFVLASAAAIAGVVWLAVTPVTLPLLAPVLLAAVAGVSAVIAFLAVSRARSAETLARAEVQRSRVLEMQLAQVAAPAARTVATVLVDGQDAPRAIEPARDEPPGWQAGQRFPLSHRVIPATRRRM
jgi:membrane protein implicated in regulation of membrane protease activity